LTRWARAHGLKLHFTCLEIASHAIEIARRRIAGEATSQVELIRGDAFTHTPLEPYDLAVASMCVHHFSNARILALLQRLREFVITGVLINDLRRSRFASTAARLLSAITAAPPGVRHDALLSVERGFRAGELSALLRRVEGATTSVKAAAWFRIAATIRFHPGKIER
jgi:SAM-dependent methyltransferase